MSIKRIIFLFIIVAVVFAVCIGFWTMHTDVVLSPSPDSADYVNEGGKTPDSKDVIVDNNDENTSDASSYGETHLDASEDGAENKDVKKLPIE